MSVYLNQNQTALPFDPTQPMQSLQPVSPGNAPFVPQVACDPRIAPFLPLISSLAIMEIQQRVQNPSTANPLRIFMFNLMAMNGYRNNEFHELIEIAANYAHLILSTNGAAGSPEAVIGNLVPTLCTMMAGAQVKFYPGLQQFMTAEQLQEAMASIQALERVVAEISRAQGRQAPPAYGQYQQTPQYPQGGFQQQSRFGGPGYGAGGGGYGGGAPLTHPALAAGQAAGFGLNPNAGGSTGLFRQPAQAPAPTNLNFTPTTPEGGSSPADRYARQLAAQLSNQNAPVAAPVAAPAPTPAINPLQQPFKPRTAADPAVQAEASSSQRQVVHFNPVKEDTGIDQAMNNMSGNVEVPPKKQVETASFEGTEVKLHEPDDVVWQRSARQPYHPVWDALRQKLRYAVLPDGTVIAVVINKTEEELKTMEFDKHVIGHVPTQPSNTTEADKPVEPVTHRPVREIKVKLEEKAELTMDITGETALFYAGLNAHISGCVEGENNGYTVQSIVALPIICKDVEQQDRYLTFLSRLNRSGSFKAAQAMLQEISNPDDLPLRNRVNDILTREVNLALLVNLSLSKARIDSFVDDIGDLDKALRQYHGDSTANALKDHEAHLIAAAINTMDKADTDSFATDQINDIPDYEKWGGRLVFITQRVSHTHLGASSYQLCMATNRTDASMLVESNTPEMLAFVRETLNNVGRDYHFFRHYFVTRDNVVIHATRGFMNTNAFMVRVEK